MTAPSLARRRAGASILAALAVAAGAGLPAAASAQEKVTLRVASFMPPQGFLPEQIVKPFLERVVADSQGTLEFKWYPGGTLGRAPAEQLKLVQDGVADIAVFRPSDGVWYLRYSGNTPPAGFQWGGGADVPVPGDYNGDGLTDIAVFRPSDGTWYLRFSGNNLTSGIQWGVGTDIPILKR